MRISLIIDGNYFLHKLIFPLINTNTLYGDLMKAMEINFKKHVSMYPYHQIWFVSDSRTSWRKDYFAEYKANRIKDKSIDWEFIFATYSEFKEKLDPTRFVYAEAKGLEGDDWISHIIKKSNLNNVGCVVMSADSDLNQLLQWRINPDYINLQYKDTINQEKLYLPEGYQVFINSIRKKEIDLFELDWRQDFFDLIEKFKRNYTFIEVDPIKSMFTKIVQGDRKDNVMSLYTTYTSNNKPRGIGEAGAIKIWNKFREINPDAFDFDSDEFSNDVVELVTEYKKLKSDDQVISTIKNNINNNLKLLRLEEQYLPIECTRNIKSVLQKHFIV